MNDQDTRELSRMIADDPVHPTPPDLAALVRSGRRVRARRRAAGGTLALGAVAALVVPVLAVAGHAGDAGGAPLRPGVASSATRAADTTSPAPAGTGPAIPTSGSTLVCGVMSCIHPPSAIVEEGQVLDETAVGRLPGGAEEVMYVARKPGIGAWAGEEVDVLSAGYRLDGELWSTVAGPYLGSDPEGIPRFWLNAGPANSHPSDADHYMVLGYVDGNPGTITWSEPDGASGEVDGLLRFGEYTAFYLSRALPADYVPPPKPTRNADGSFTVETDDARATFRSGDVIRPGDLMGGATPLSPDLIIHTSDGWSCSLEECGAEG